MGEGQQKGQEAQMHLLSFSCAALASFSSFTPSYNLGSRYCQPDKGTEAQRSKARASGMEDIDPGLLIPEPRVFPLYLDSGV